MKIKKTYQGVVPNGKVLNSKSNSTTDTYSCDYLNELIPKTKIITGTTNSNGLLIASVCNLPNNSKVLNVFNKTNDDSYYFNVYNFDDGTTRPNVGVVVYSASNFERVANTEITIEITYY